MRYPIVDGKVQTRALEYHILDHCNLRCDHCCSFSPLLGRWLADVEQFEKDLLKVREVIAPRILKIVGGEPLLHPKLERLLAIAQESGIAPQVSLTTNGFLLERLSDSGWSNIQLLTISLYPDPALPRDKIRWIADKANSHGIRVSWKVQDRFVCLDRSELSSDEEAQATFNACWIHHRCNSIKNGRFYNCTRPQYIQKLAEDPAPFLADGIAIDDPDLDRLAKRLQEHLRQENPLNSCFLCQGGHAESRTHHQLDEQQLKEKRERTKNLCQRIARAGDQ